MLALIATTIPALLIGHGVLAGNAFNGRLCGPRMDGFAGKGAYSLQNLAPADMDVQAVEAMLAKRAEAKSARDYEVADVLQADLKAMGVFIDDRKRTWVVAAANSGGYVLMGEAPAGVDLADVEATLGKRREAKNAQDFDKADQMQEELKALGLYVDDKKMTWGQSKNDASKGKVEPKTFSLVGPSPEGVDVEAVEAILAKRVQAKKAREFEASDALQAELLKMGVYVNDKKRTWEEAKWVKAGGKKPPAPAAEAAAPDDATPAEAAVAS
jgi:cysteinyl-tRNA synthetase